MVDAFVVLNGEIEKLKKQQPTLKCGTVTNASPFQVRFDGEDSSNTYKKPKSYTPILNDRVCFLVQGNNYICLGGYE